MIYTSFSFSSSICQRVLPPGMALYVIPVSWYIMNADGIIVFLCDSYPRQKSPQPASLSPSVWRIPSLLHYVYENSQLRAQTGPATGFQSQSKCRQLWLNMDCVTDVIMNKYGYLFPTPTQCTLSCLLFLSSSSRCESDSSILLEIKSTQFRRLLWENNELKFIKKGPHFLLNSSLRYQKH